MDNLIAGPTGAKRPLFRFEGPDPLPASAIPQSELTLSGPSEQLDAAHWPVRGDLAHIRLAGRVFVPHYAVPMEHKVIAPGVSLRVLDTMQADVRDELASGTLFNVLDMAGGWAWGQVGDDGFVGYVPLDALAP